MKNIHHDPHVVEPTSTHTHTLIILHGRGSNGPKFGSALLESPSTTQALTLPALIPGLKIICPTAAKRRSTVLKRVPIHQWFDIYSLVDPSEREDLQLDGLKETAAYVRSLIEIESRNIPSERIFLGGLSQGCAAAVFVLLTLEGRLGGFIGMSGWFPLVRHVLDVLERPAGTNRTLNDDMDGDDDDDPFETEAGESLSPPLQALNLLRGYIDMDPLDPDESTTSSVLQTPVLLGHGELDDKVDCCLGRQMANALKSLSMDVEFMAYAGLGHWYKVPEQVQDIAVFLLVALLRLLHGLEIVSIRAIAETNDELHGTALFQPRSLCFWRIVLKRFSFPVSPQRAHSIDVPNSRAPSKLTLPQTAPL